MMRAHVMASCVYVRTHAVTIPFLPLSLLLLLTSFHHESTCDKQLRKWKNHATTTLPMQQYLRSLMLKKSFANITCIFVYVRRPCQHLFNLQFWIILSIQPYLRTCCCVDVGVNTAWRKKTHFPMIFILTSTYSLWEQPTAYYVTGGCMRPL